MGPLDHLDVTIEQLDELVQGSVWLRWTVNEPALAELDKPSDLRALRGPQADQLLGALVRLAAHDGGDDELAARAVAHQLGGEAARIARGLRDLGPEIDHVVLASLWMEIRTFPWRRRARAYATSLSRATQRSALRHMLPPPADRKRLVLKPPDDFAERPMTSSELSEGATAEQSRAELVGYLDWCAHSGRISYEDATLMLELVAAGWQTAGAGVLKLKRGVCSLHAVQVVADRRGLCAKTIIRERDRVLARLKEAAVDYIHEVA